MGLCLGIEPGKFRAKAADLPPGHRHMFPGCADSRGLDNYSRAGPACQRRGPSAGRKEHHQLLKEISLHSLSSLLFHSGSLPLLHCFNVVIAPGGSSAMVQRVACVFHVT